MEKKLEENKDEVTLKELVYKFEGYFSFMKRKIFHILAVTVIGILIGYLYTVLAAKKEYTANIKFLVDGGAQPAASNPLDILGITPTASSGGASGDIFEALDVTFLMTSSPLLERTLLSKMSYNNQTDYVINFFIKYRQKEKNFFGKKVNYVGQELYKGKRDSLDLVQNELLRKVMTDISSDLKVVRGVSGSMVVGTFKATDSLFPKYFLEKLIDETSKLYSYTKVAKTVQNLRLLEHQADSIRVIMGKNIQSSAYSADIDPNSIRPTTVKVGYQKKQVDNAVLQSTYQTLASSVVNTRIELGKKMPFIQIFERPIFPLSETTGSSKQLNMIKFGTGAFLLAFIFFSLTYLVLEFRSYMKS